MTATKLPKVGYATAIDLGDPTSPFHPVHPRRKQEVGRRLALAVRRIQYKDQTVIPYGPEVKNITQ